MTTLSPFVPIRSALVLIYSLIMSLLAPVLAVAARFNPKLASQLAGRKSAGDLARELARPRAAKKHCVVFFCSSAGEFEQARPLVARFEASGDTFVHVIFFSRSGADFAQARNEEVSYSLAPAVDSVWGWGNLFSALRPDIVAVVRHELWPAFLETARHFAPLYLIDASRSLGESTSGGKRFARGQLLRYFDTIYVVSESDALFFKETYGLPDDLLVVTGDTKYDRVRERALAKNGESSRLDARLGGDPTRRLVLGSAHAPDVDVWLEAWRSLGAAAAGWQVVVAPHHVDSANVQAIAAKCRDAGLGTTLWSELPSGRPDVVIVDAMGLLAEIYGASALAFVGGAIHQQVHNVLEPACHGLGLAFGSRHDNSQEALHLAKAGLADVCNDAPGLAAWWRNHQHPDGARRQRLLAAVAALCGASERIATAWTARMSLDTHA